MEWHADLTHQELMMETEEEMLQEIKENAIKEKKKSKKKKKRKGSSKKNTIPEPAVAHIDEGSESTCLTEQDNENGQVSPTSVESFPISEPLIDSSGKSSTNQNKKLVKNEPENKAQSPSRSVREKSPTASSLREAPCEVPSNGETLEDEHIEVCVTDKAEKISAEFFLCSRYFQVLEDRNIKIY